MGKKKNKFYLNKKKKEVEKCLKLYFFFQNIFLSSFNKLNKKKKNNF
jgi:hypothetical protein